MIRPLEECEIKMASDLADGIYPVELEEGYEAFLNKFSFFPEGFLGFFVDDKLVGYVVGHPWDSRKGVVPLNFKIGKINSPDCFYIHDIAFLESYRGMGYGEKLFSDLINLAKEKGFTKFLLVAVSDESRAFVEKFGFSFTGKLNYGKLEVNRMELLLKL
jgi:ribosomal protein S18 acetylase RimI-like enzyme